MAARNARWTLAGTMLFRPTLLLGVRLIELEPARDERGFFARTFCTHEFAAQGLQTGFVQHSISHTERAVRPPMLARELAGRLMPHLICERAFTLFGACQCCLAKFLQ